MKGPPRGSRASGEPPARRTDKAKTEVVAAQDIRLVRLVLEDDLGGGLQELPEVVSPLRVMFNRERLWKATIQL